MTDALVEAVARAVAEAIPETKWAWTESIVDGNLIVPIEGDLNMHHLATAALQAIEAAGYRVVPVEATEGMVAAGVYSRGSMHEGRPVWKCPYDVQARYSYTAMLSAAPRVANKGEEE